MNCYSINITDTVLNKALLAGNNKCKALNTNNNQTL